MPKVKITATMEVDGVKCSLCDFELPLGEASGHFIAFDGPSHWDKINDEAREYKHHLCRDCYAYLANNAMIRKELNVPLKSVVS